MIMMVRVGRGSALSFLGLIAILACCTFMKGFFPVKRMIAGRSADADLPKALGSRGSELGEDAVDRPIALFDRCIVMVIDALRADFLRLQEEHMPFTQKLIAEGYALAYTAYSHPPTVTLPRIKALMTGTIPGFVDVVLNFGSTELQEDNLVDQFLSQGRKAVFFGDDTWLKLFPGQFDRSEGTTSFFVADYTEVDDNVTRHLDRELAAEDWSLMILHYLGLDHIGHLSSFRSPLIPSKLKEMDGIIMKIFNSMEKSERRTLLLVCGDHGMTDSGGHGGASPGETTVPALFISPTTGQRLPASVHVESVQQVDVAPTLATALGLPIPVNSLGALLPSVLSGLPTDTLVTALQINAAQVLAVLQHNTDDLHKEEGYLQYVRAQLRHSSWLGLKGNLSVNAWEQLAFKVMAEYSLAMRTMAGQIAQAATNYDLYALGVAVAFFWMLVALLVQLARSTTSYSVSITATHLLQSLAVCLPLFLGHVTLCTGWNHSSCLCHTHLAGAITQAGLFLCVLACLTLQGALFFQPSKQVSQAEAPGRLEVFLAGGTLLHTASLLSSSFVEEEHQTWYFLSTSFHVLAFAALASKMLVPSKAASRSQDDCEHYDPCAPGSEDCDRDKGESSHMKQTSHLFKETTSADGHDSVSNRHKRPAALADQRGSEREQMWMPARLLKTFAGGDQDGGGSVARQQIVWRVMSLSLVMALCRLLRAWNQTGDKWLHLPDIGDWFNSPACKPELSVCVVLALLCLMVLWAPRLSRMQTPVFCIACVCIYCFRAAQGAILLPGVYSHPSRGVLEARGAYACAAVLLLCWWWETSGAARQWWQCGRGWRQLQAAWLVLMLLLLRPHNIPLVALLCMAETLGTECLQHLQLGPASVAVWCAWMGQTSFFFQGNSNSVSSVDVSAGFVGVDFYLPALHGLLMFTATYAGPVFWDLTALRCLCTRGQTQSHPNPQHRLAGGLLHAATVLLLRRVLVLAVYTALMTVQRYHLFVWTVFSPKLLYEGISLVLALVSCLLLSVLACRIRTHQGKP